MRKITLTTVVLVAIVAIAIITRCNLALFGQIQIPDVLWFFLLGVLTSNLPRFLLGIFRKLHRKPQNLKNTRERFRFYDLSADTSESESCLKR